MQIKNTDFQYGVMAIVMHWVMTILIIGMLIMGLYMTRLPTSPWQFKLFGWHKEWGMMTLLLIFIRLTWRLSNIRPLLTELPKWEAVSALTVHWLLYILLFAMPLTGWLMTSAAGFPVSFFGLFVIPTLIPANEQHMEFFSEVHTWLAYCLIALIILHTAAALKHYFINRDTILQRMLRP